MKKFSALLKYMQMHVYILTKKKYIPIIRKNIRNTKDENEIS